MQADTTNIIPVNSVVNEFLQDEITGFDSYVSAAFKELSIKQKLARANTTKRSGVSTELLFFNLVQIPFLMENTLFLLFKRFVKEKKLQSLKVKQQSTLKSEKVIKLRKDHQDPMRGKLYRK